jgi:hypothetical protein
MGYELHITRRANWFDDDGPSIDLDEWLLFLRSDPEMRLDGYAEATTTAGETIRYESRGLAVWTAYSGHGRDGNMAWFDWRSGVLSVKNPDDEIVGKMCKIAQSLDARVQGDEGEEYATGWTQPSPPPEQQATPRTKKPWWKIW